MRGSGALCAGVALVAALGTAGCTMVTERINPFAQGSSGMIRLYVENNNYNQATISALGNLRRRIGIVGGHRSESFRIDWPNADELQLEIDILAGGSYITNSVPLEPGEAATLYIQEPNSLSTLVRGGSGK
ncbi:MAG: hypothetical protein J4F34_03825 [Gemmatimonadetes bacterium]|nr:hypothetical protein [Gemmatimonadota bacterium]